MQMLQENNYNSCREEHCISCPEQYCYGCDNTGECLGKMCPAKCTVRECSKCHLQHCFDHRLKVYKELWSSEQKWSMEKYSGCIAILAPKIILTYDMYGLKRKPEDVEEWRNDVEYSDISNKEDWCDECSNLGNFDGRLEVCRKIGQKDDWENESCLDCIMCCLTSILDECGHMM